MKPGSADQRSSEAKDLVVFDILRQSKCADCGKKLLGGDFLFMEGERALCLTCADLDHLVYLPRGDTALTRRARKHSTLSAYLDRLAHAAGHLDRVVPLKFYCTGLLLPGERKSVEPMAARLCPDNVRQTHQSLHHVVAHAPWSDTD